MKSPQDLINEILQAGKRQTDIADHTGLSKAYISEMKSGITTRPGYVTMCQLTEYHALVMRGKAKAERRAQRLAARSIAEAA